VHWVRFRQGIRSRKTGRNPSGRGPEIGFAAFVMQAVVLSDAYETL
jgi:hypothetical protein